MPATLSDRIPLGRVTDPRQRLIVALDVSTAAAAQKIVATIGDSALTYKVGMQLYTAEGPQVVRDLIASGRRVFLDLKETLAVAFAYWASSWFDSSSARSCPFLT